MGHVSRANPVWAALHAERPSVVMFQGPQAYITPGWYPSKQAHGKVVPTWNYSVAHVHGVATAIHDKEWLRALLDLLTNAQESLQENPWAVADAPAAFIDKMLTAIVGIEIPVDQLLAKLKVSQDEEQGDRRGTVAGLVNAGGSTNCALAALVDQALTDGPFGQT